MARLGCAGPEEGVRQVQSGSYEEGLERSSGWGGGARGWMPGRPERFFPVLCGDTVGAGHSQVRWLMLLRR